MNRKLLKKRLLFFITLLSICLSASLFLNWERADLQTKISLGDILTGLRSKKIKSLSEKNQLLIEAVKKRGVNFAITPQVEAILKSEGANDALIKAIRENAPKTELKLDQKVVKVSNVTQFIKAIAPNTRIELTSGTYNITDAALTKTPYITWEDPGDGYEPIISNVDNLTIVGEKGTKILIEPRYAFVMNFVKSKNITFENVILGHTEGGYCEGGVLNFTKSENITINNSTLFGSGTYGLLLEWVVNLKMTNSQIRECTYGAMRVLTSREILFENSIFENNQQFDLIEVKSSEKVLFSNCTISNNHPFRADLSSSYYLFKIEDSFAQVYLDNSKIINNMISKFTNDRGAIILKNNQFSGNKFTDFADKDLNMVDDSKKDNN